MVTEYNIGLMALIMKVIGVLIKLKVKVLFGMLKVTSIEVSLRMIWLMVMGNIFILMDRNIKENLEMIYKKVKGKKNGLMALNMWEHT